jgi:hypothetical protein
MKFRIRERILHAEWPQTYASCIDRPNFKTGRVQRARLLLEFICSRKRVVAQIHVVLEGERDLAVGE